MIRRQLISYRKRDVVISLKKLSKSEEGSYGHISEGFSLAEFYLLRVSIQNLGEWLTCDLALQVNFLYV